MGEKAVKADKGKKEVPDIFFYFDTDDDSREAYNLIQKWLINKGINVETIGGASDIELPSLVEHYVEYRGIDKIRKYVERRMNLTRVYNFKRWYTVGFYTTKSSKEYGEPPTELHFADGFYIPEQNIIIYQICLAQMEHGKHYFYEDRAEKIDEIKKLISGEEEPWWLASEIGINEYEKEDIKGLIETMETLRQLRQKSTARIDEMVKDAKDTPMKHPKEI